MNLDETRQLGIEFERRVQTMIPETQIISKLDTETIYSYLNLYLDKFIHDIYKAIDNIPTPSKPSAYVETILQGLLTTTDSIQVTKNSDRFSVNLPNNFGLYVDSYTTVSDSHRYKNYTWSKINQNGAGLIPNLLVSKTKALDFQLRPQDNMRIMRLPIAYLDDNKKITVMCDRYTQPTSFTMSYYKIPGYMNLFEDKPCELSMEVFDDLVTGAVDLYVQYVAGAEAKKRQILEQLLRQNKKESEE